MQAMVLQSPRPIDENPLVLIDVPAPVPGPGQLRLRVDVCGVCHTDLHTVEGELELPKLPLIPGHQIVGTVDESGAGVTRFRLGDRVGVAWLHSACGKCDFCQRGLENLCPDARFTGLHVDGGYAQYTLAEERFAYIIPERFSAEEASPLLCAGIIGYRALRLSEIRPGENLGLYGFGASAHIALQVARHWGCAVYVFTRGEHHRRLAAELGAVWTGSAQNAPPVAMDASVTFAPVGSLIPLALRHLRPGGTLAINAIYMTPLPEMPYTTIYQERTLRSVTNFTSQDAVEFLKIAADVPVRTEVELFPLSDANRVLQKLKRSEIRGAAALKMP